MPESLAEIRCLGSPLRADHAFLTVAYGDVSRVRDHGRSKKPFLIVTVATAGAALAIALILHHKLEKNKPALPPPMRSTAVFP